MRSARGRLGPADGHRCRPGRGAPRAGGWPPGHWPCGGGWASVLTMTLPRDLAHLVRAAVICAAAAGRTWINASPAGASALQFRDIAAFSATRAVAMAAGTGTDSRLYFTADGGRTWRLAYRNTNRQAFFDCMAFFNPRHGLVLSDPV